MTDYKPGDECWLRTGIHTRKRVTILSYRYDRHCTRLHVQLFEDKSERWVRPDQLEPDKS